MFARTSTRSLLRAIPIVLALCLALASCARFRIEELEPAPVFSLPVARAGETNPQGYVQIMENGRVAYNFPIEAAMGGAAIYIADPARRLVRVFNRGAERPNRLYGETEPADLEDVRFVKLRLGIPGRTAADEDGEHVYIQSFPDSASGPAAQAPAPVEPENRLSGQVSDIRVQASSILHLNEDGELLGVYGVGGYNSAPFPFVHRLTADENGLLHVAYRGAAGLTLASFKDGALVQEYREFAAGSEEEQRKYIVEMEELAPGPEGRFALACAALRKRSDYDLVERIVYRLDGPAGPPLELLRSDDSQDHFAWSRPDGGFYLMNTKEDGSRILFKIFSPEGEYLSNRLIVFPGLRISWRETFLSLDGRIYTARLFLGKFELYEWK